MGHSIRKMSLKGAIVVKFDQGGCQGTDHTFEWIGTVTDFIETQHAGEAAVVKIIKRANNHLDDRSIDLGYERIVIEDPCLQQIQWRLFFLIS